MQVNSRIACAVLKILLRKLYVFHIKLNVMKHLFGQVGLHLVSAITSPTNVFRFLAIYFGLEILVMLVMSVFCWILYQNFKFEVGDKIESYLMQVGVTCSSIVFDWL